VLNFSSEVIALIYYLLAFLLIVPGPAIALIKAIEGYSAHKKANSLRTDPSSLS
jgi:hypothetical protein